MGDRRPEGYDALRNGMPTHERGRYFEIGRAYLEKETREAGWQQQVPLGSEGRILDSAQVNPRTGKIDKARERKSGRVEGRDAVRQVEKEIDALREGSLVSSRWETVEGETISREVQIMLDLAKREFPDRFEHRVVSREDARLAILEGQRIARARQLELPGLSRDRLKQRQQEREARQRAQREADRVRKSREQQARTRGERLAKTYGRFRDGAERGFDAIARAHHRAGRLTYALERFRDVSERARTEVERRAAAEREARRLREQREARERSLERLPEDVADALRRSFPAPGEELRHRGIEPHGGSTRAGREARVRALERERGREGRSR
ncbi:MULTISPECIES: hypothetical protein [Nocardia]|uniref:Uncharacterized protein n=1 Tax=Nocardia africana TaxID=134964 RepID=A0A378X7D1_9NOCA|nr:hypothetical protein [Nocardia africana]MCC3317871.1 hypothetical protein [Nocardia africana]SUA48644.1 Uncharacterised protein [Nocardia africana]